MLLMGGQGAGQLADVLHLMQCMRLDHLLHRKRLPNWVAPHALQFQFRGAFHKLQAAGVGSVNS